MKRPGLVHLMALILFLAGGLVLGYRALGLQGGETGLFLAGVQAPVARLSASWWSWGQDLFRFRELSDRNRNLQSELSRLQREREETLALRTENRRLRALLDLRLSQHPQGLACEVAARDPNLWYSQLVLDRGTRGGVAKDMVVVAPEGLVGRVFQVSPGACRVRLLLDARTAVPAVLAESGAMGVVYGDDGHACTMKFIDHDVPIREGELVLTSGLGEIYPGGLALGRVTRRLGRTEALFQSVQVHPIVDFGSLRHVLVVGRTRGG